MRSRGTLRAPSLPIRLAGGLLAASAIASVAFHARALSPGGAIAAAIVGGCVFAGVSVRGSAALIVYFFTSTLLGRLPIAATAQQRRGNRRDAVQVLANGGIPAALSIVSCFGSPRMGPLAQAGYFGAVASATSDTWATEVGTRLGRNPRSIVTLQPTTPGASGGITLAGLGGSLLGAAMIAFIAVVKPSSSSACQRSTAFAIAFGGITGSLVDSLLGAAVQEVRMCPTCGVETELLVHCRSVATRRTRGAAWCNNDIVNALSTAIGACATMALLGSLHLRNRHEFRQAGRSLTLVFDNSLSIAGRVWSPCIARRRHANPIRASGPPGRQANHGASPNAPASRWSAGRPFA